MTASKVVAFFALASSSLACSAGSMPWARRSRALRRSSRALAREMPCLPYSPNVSVFSWPLGRWYFIRQTLLPEGRTRRYRPWPSVSLYGFSRGLAASHLESERGTTVRAIGVRSISNRAVPLFVPLKNWIVYRHMDLYGHKKAGSVAGFFGLQGHSGP
ncbi:hypothetical protein D9M70_577520 [compost metagenome]